MLFLFVFLNTFNELPEKTEWITEPEKELAARLVVDELVALAVLVSRWKIADFPYSWLCHEYQIGSIKNIERSNGLLNCLWCLHVHLRFVLRFLYRSVGLVVWIFVLMNQKSWCQFLLKLHYPHQFWPLGPVFLNIEQEFIIWWKLKAVGCFNY